MCKYLATLDMVTGLHAETAWLQMYVLGKLPITQSKHNKIAHHCIHSDGYGWGKPVHCAGNIVWHSIPRLHNIAICHGQHVFSISKIRANVPRITRIHFTALIYLPIDCVPPSDLRHATCNEQSSTMVRLNTRAVISTPVRSSQRRGQYLHTSVVGINYLAIGRGTFYQHTMSQFLGNRCVGIKSKA